jgi:MOSC domain-containing protein YiiM
VSPRVDSGPLPAGKGTSVARILALCAGRVRERRDTEGTWSSAVLKTPVPGPVPATQDGLAGDEVRDRRHHGGADKALLCYSAAHYPRWRAETGLDLPPGAFGENLLLVGLDEEGACLGDTWAAGDALLQISQPRMPCWKPARLWGRPALADEMGRSGRTGWYLRVTQTGVLEAGMVLELRERPHPDWSVARCWRTWQARGEQPTAWAALRSLPELAVAWRE